MAGVTYLAKEVPLPQVLRLGYHDLKIYWMKDPELETFGDSRFIVCPRRARQIHDRVAGVALSLYGLRSARNWGCGDFTDLRAAIEVFAKAGAAFVALNPLHAIPNRQPYNISPYLPQCSLYRNFIYLDIERVGNMANLEALTPQIEALRASEFVEYEGVAQLKLSALKTLFREFTEAGGASDFDRYVDAEGALLHDFAVYCALEETIHSRHPEIWLWTDWPPQYRDPRSQAVAEFAQEHSQLVTFYKFVQWQIDRQLAETQAHALEMGMSIGLYHDLALATDRYGADLWAHRDFYVSACRVGSPPDDFSPSGQDWAFPPPNRDAHRENGYELFAQSIRKNARHGGALRIDHVMRLFHLYWIAAGMPAAEGAYVHEYDEDLLGVLALESVRGNFIAIGEDLGTVTAEVRQTLAESGILSYRVLWFERNPDGRFRRPDEYPAQAAVSTTTHDLPTLAGFGAARDIEARRAAGLIDSESYRRQMAEREEAKLRLNEALTQAGFAQDPDRVPALDALRAGRRQPGRPYGRDRAAEFARQHRAVSQLAAKDESRGGGSGSARGAARHRDREERQKTALGAVICSGQGCDYECPAAVSREERSAGWFFAVHYLPFSVLSINFRASNIEISKCRRIGSRTVSGLLRA